MMRADTQQRIRWHVHRDVLVPGLRCGAELESVYLGPADLHIQQMGLTGSAISNRAR